MTEKLRLRESIYILEESEGIYQVIFTSTRQIKRFRVDGLVKRVVEELLHEKDIGELIDSLSKDYNVNQIMSCLASMKNEGIIREYSPRKEDRYSKQMLFLDELTSSWEETMELQEKLQNSVFAVFGVGGIGTWIVNGLHQMGVGEIRIVDPDIVEESNLNRQLFFDSGDIGKYKVDVIKGKLKDAKIVPFKESVDPEQSLERIVGGCNFLVNCADFPSIQETTRIIDGYAKRLGIPYCIAGGYNLHLGMVGPIIIPGVTATFDDFLKYQQLNDPLSGLCVIKSVEQTGNLGPIAGAIANIQVMEIFKYLVGRGELNINKFAEIDFMNLSVEWRHFGNREKNDT